MPRLKDLIPTTELVLPVSGAKVQCATALTLAESMKISDAETDSLRALLTIQFVIKGWDFVDEEDKPLPITEETIGLIPGEDAEAIMDYVATLVNKKRKDKEERATKEPEAAAV